VSTRLQNRRFDRFDEADPDLDAASAPAPDRRRRVDPVKSVLLVAAALASVMVGVVAAKSLVLDTQKRSLSIQAPR
jgi:hypothetical protein